MKPVARRVERGKEEEEVELDEEELDFGGEVLMVRFDEGKRGLDRGLMVDLAIRRVGET